MIRVQNAPNPEQHSRVSLFQFSPSLSNAINLRQNFPLIRLIGGNKRLEDRFVLLKRGVQIY